MGYIPGDFHSPAIRSIPFANPSTKGGGDAGRFILTTNPTGGAAGATGACMTATANIVREDDPTITLASGITLYLEFEIFEDLVSGDYGPAVKDARGKWIAMNARCLTSGGSS